MTINICDVCGVKLPANFDKLDEKKRKLSFMNNPYGYFEAIYARAETDGDGKVIAHSFSRDLILCPECADRLDAGIRDVITKIMEDKPESRTYKIKAPYLEMEPIRLPDRAGDIPVSK